MIVHAFLPAYRTDLQYKPWTPEISCLFGNTLQVLSNITAGRTKGVPVQFHWAGRDTRKLVPGVSQTSPSTSLSFADLHLDSLTVINHNHKCNSFPESCESSQRTIWPDSVLGILDLATLHTHHQSIFLKGNQKLRFQTPSFHLPLNVLLYKQFSSSIIGLMPLGSAIRPPLLHIPMSSPVSSGQSGRLFSLEAGGTSHPRL